MASIPMPGALLAMAPFTMADAARHGLSPQAVAAAERRGELVRLRRGWYGPPLGPGPTADAAAFVQRSLAASRAWHLPMTGRSALAHLGLPVFGIGAAVPALAGRPAARRSTKTVSIVPRLPGVGEGTAECVSLAEAIAATALRHPDAALVAADAAVRSRMLAPQDLAEAASTLGNRRGSTGARAVLGLVDGLRESPGESRVAWLMHGWGWPLEPQILVRTRLGDFRLDGVVRGSRVGIEFDGRLKYEDDALFREKRREDAIREVGYTLVRVVWADLYRPAELRERIARALALDARLRAA